MRRCNQEQCVLFPAVIIIRRRSKPEPNPAPTTYSALHYSAIYGERDAERANEAACVRPGRNLDWAGGLRERGWRRECVSESSDYWSNALLPIHRYNGRALHYERLNGRRAASFSLPCSGARRTRSRNRGAAFAADLHDKGLYKYLTDRQILRASVFVSAFSLLRRINTRSQRRKLFPLWR